ARGGREPAGDAPRQEQVRAQRPDREGVDSDHEEGGGPKPFLGGLPVEKESVDGPPQEGGDGQGTEERQQPRTQFRPPDRGTPEQGEKKTTLQRQTVVRERNVGFRHWSPRARCGREGPCLPTDLSQMNAILSLGCNVNG